MAGHECFMAAEINNLVYCEGISAMGKLGKNAVCVVAVAVALGVVAAAEAELIVNGDVRLNTYSGQGALADPGNNHWSGYNLADTNPDPVNPWIGRNNNIASDGTTVTTIGWWINNASSGGDQSSANTNDVTNGYYFELDKTMTLTFYNLNPGKTYDLYLYGCQDSFGGRGSTFTIGEVTKTTDGQLAGLAGGFKEGSTHAVFDGLSPDGSNKIVVNITNGPQGAIGFIDGFQIREVVPEPSTLALLAGALFGLIAYAWRKRKN